MANEPEDFIDPLACCADCWMDTRELEDYYGNSVLRCASCIGKLLAALEDEEQETDGKHQ